jgi:flagellar M-ring protein FliF
MADDNAATRIALPEKHDDTRSSSRSGEGGIVNFDQMLRRLSATAGALSGKQLATLAIAFVAVVSLTIGSAYYINTPNYSVLFSDMDTDAASAVVTKLKEQKVAYTLDDGGRTVRVPQGRVDELRLDLASQGMPGSGHVGFELFDRTAFGVTDFLEHVNYRRALEGELARTISTIGEVAGARVHIAMPQPSLFIGREQQTKASVVLKLKNNRQLAPATVTAITGLVAASVESLRPESVVLIDNFGRPLSRPADAADDQADGVPLERQQRIEHDLTGRVASMIEPIVGVGRVRVNVSAKLKSATQEETEERFDPAPVVRSHQSVMQSTGTPTGAAGVAGTRSNLPPDPANPADRPETLAAPAAAAKSTAQHVAETTNYEVGKLTRHNMQPRGDIAKLSVAVVLDDDRTVDEKGVPHSQARPAPELKKIHDLVAAAVGLDTERGDQLTVENIPFEETPVETAPVVPIWREYAPQAFEVGRVLGIVVIGIFAVFSIIRPLVRGSLPGHGVQLLPTAGGVIGAPRSVQDLEAEIDAELANLAPGARRLPVLTKRVSALTQREPENAARLLRTWLTEDEK